MHVDLNLLTALDALLEENSVQAAADRLHVTQPAMSRTLARIRRATGDDILVRTGRVMSPTPRAIALRDEVHALVQRANEVLRSAGVLDLASLRRTFAVQGHDALIGALAPALTAVAAAEAPLVALRFLAESGVDTHDLARGQVDIELGSALPSAAEVAYEELGHDRMVVVMAEGHPLAGKRLTAKRFAEARHIAVSRRGRPRGVVDDALEARGLQRATPVVVPTSAAALLLVAQGDAMVVVAERLCRPAREALMLMSTPLPFPLPPVPVVMAWHSRYETDPAHRWLRTRTRWALQEALTS